MEWTEETIARLRELWAEEHSTAEIARRMGISKNAVVGKAHRLNLDGRPSPIRREGNPRNNLIGHRDTRGKLREQGTLALLSAGLGADAPERPLQPIAPLAPLISRPAAIQPDVAKPHVVPARAPRTQSCCWPLGDVGTRSFRFCDADAMPGKPYCAEHAAVAHVKVRGQREEATA